MDNIKVPTVPVLSVRVPLVEADDVVPGWHGGTAVDGHRHHRGRGADNLQVVRPDCVQGA